MHRILIASTLLRGALAVPLTTSIGNSLFPASLCPPGPYASLSVPSSPPALLVDTGLDWAEGPVAVASKSSLLFTAANNVASSDGNGPNSTIFAWDWTTFQQSVYSQQGVVRSNGLAIDKAGNIFAAVHSDQSVTELVNGSPSNQKVIAKEYQGNPFNSPNDLAIADDGTIYMSDPTWQQENRPGQSGNPSTQRLYKISPNGTVSAFMEGNEPNGVILSLDQSLLYVGGLDKSITAYPVNDPSHPTTFVANTSSDVDGMAIDCAGNIYATLNDLKQIAIYNPSGTGVGNIQLNETNSNMAFGGPDMKTLYITGSGKLWSLEMPIPGLPY